MVKENEAPTKEAPSAGQSTCTLLVSSAPEKKEELVVCEVCGHANPKYTALCRMCSNYLK